MIPPEDKLKLIDLILSAAINDFSVRTLIKRVIDDTEPIDTSFHAWPERVEKFNQEITDKQEIYKHSKPKQL